MRRRREDAEKGMINPRSTAEKNDKPKSTAEKKEDKRRNKPGGGLPVLAERQ